MTLALTITAGLLARPGLAQRAPVAPLVPVVVTPLAPVVVMGQSVPAARQPTVAVRIVDFPSRTRMPSPLYLVNSKIIISDGTLASINPQDIAKITVYKDDKMPASWRTTLTNGVLDILLKKGAGALAVARQPEARDAPARPSALCRGRAAPTRRFAPGGHQRHWPAGSAAHGSQWAARRIEYSTYQTPTNCG
ncbi:MAG: hypothetical protein WKG07_39195 [Hymenobacter sp.]